MPGDRVFVRRTEKGPGNNNDVEHKGDAEQETTDGEPRQPFAEQSGEEEDESTQVEGERHAPQRDRGERHLQRNRHELVAGADDHRTDEPERHQVHQRQQAEPVELPLHQRQCPGRGENGEGQGRDREAHEPGGEIERRCVPGIEGHHDGGLDFWMRISTRPGSGSRVRWAYPISSSWS